MTNSNSLTFEIQIEQIVPGGLGLGRSEGRVILVPLTAVGDRVAVEVALGETTGQLATVLTPGSERAEPPCPHFGVCGGCDFMHLTYEAQLHAKVGMIEDALRRNGRFAEWPEFSVVASSEPLANRLRATWRPSPNGGAGYFRRESNEVIDITTCPILDPALEARRLLLAPRDTVQALSNGRDISMAEGGDGDKASPITIDVGDLRLMASADVFFQANGALIKEFADYVVSVAAPEPGHRIHDLFCGLGLYSIPLARLAETVDGVDGHELAIERGLENARLNQVTNCAFHVMTVENWLRNCPAADVTVIDPPRAGLSKATVNLLPAKVRERLVYVSCDPVTFARDARRLVDRGMKFTAFMAFDMFPQTHHVELVATFEKSARSRRRAQKPLKSTAEIEE